MNEESAERRARYGRAVRELRYLERLTGSGAAIRVHPGGPDETMTDAPAGQVITAIFRDPQMGADLPVKIRLFQNDASSGSGFGVGVYMTDGNGTPLWGTVLRWDGGPDSTARPTVINWTAPHCADDECGSPCGHHGER